MAPLETAGNGETASGTDNAAPVVAAAMTAEADKGDMKPLGPPLRKPPGPLVIGGGKGISGPFGDVVPVEGASGLAPSQGMMGTTAGEPAVRTAMAPMARS